MLNRDSRVPQRGVDQLRRCEMCHNMGLRRGLHEITEEGNVCKWALSSPKTKLGAKIQYPPKRTMQERLKQSGEMNQKMLRSTSRKQGALVGRHEALHRPTWHHHSLGKV